MLVVLLKPKWKHFSWSENYIYYSSTALHPSLEEKNQKVTSGIIQLFNNINNGINKVPQIWDQNLHIEKKLFGTFSSTEKLHTSLFNITFSGINIIPNWHYQKIIPKSPFQSLLSFLKSD